MKNPNNPQQSGESQNPQTHSSNNLISKEVVGYLVLIIVAFGVGVGVFAFNYVTKDSERLKFWVGFMFSFTALVVIVAQSLIYVQQSEFMKQQAQASNRLIGLMARSECAYVTVSDWELPANVTNGLVVTAKLLNAGRTPALDLKRTIRLAVGEGYPPIGWGRIDWDSIPHDKSEGVVLAANREVKLSNDPMEIPPAVLAEINRGSHFIVVDGQCRYFDILGSLQIYEFGIIVELGPPPRAVIRYQQHTRQEAKEDKFG